MGRAWPKEEVTLVNGSSGAERLAHGGKPDESEDATITTDEKDCAFEPPPFPRERRSGVSVREDASGPRLREQSVAMTEPAPSVLTVDELAALLRVNRKTVYDALARGEIPGARRIGGCYRILRDRVLDWLAAGQGRVSRSRRSP